FCFVVRSVWIERNSFIFIGKIFHLVEHCATHLKEVISINAMKGCIVQIYRRNVVESFGKTSSLLNTLFISKCLYIYDVVVIRETIRQVEYRWTSKGRVQVLSILCFSILNRNTNSFKNTQCMHSQVRTSRDK